MRKCRLYSSFLMAILIAGCGVNSVKHQSDFPEPPHPQKISKDLTIHGNTRIDPYYWLNERQNPAVLDYLKAENRYLDTVMADTKKAQEELFNELVGRIKQNDESVPYLDNGFFYYTRYEKGKEYPIYCRKKGSLTAA